MGNTPITQGRVFQPLIIIKNSSVSADSDEADSSAEAERRDSL